MLGGGMAAISLPMIGDEWAGYRLRGIIGRGGMSAVYEAENPRLGSSVALKVLAPELAEDDVFRARFLKESRIAASLNHPNVVPIYDMGSSAGLLYIAMRYVSGADLRSVLKLRHRLPPDEALALVGQAARALDAAHRQELVHRDVKPGNILVERGSDEDDPDHVYLSDFGISKHANSRSGLTATGEFMGTIDYLAPEQIQGRSVDGRADIYSLGCVMYECLTGRVPFVKDIDAAIIWAHVEEQPTLPSVIRAELPSGIDDVIMRAMAKQPEDRYHSCREFIGAARAALAGSSAAPHTATSRPGPRPTPAAGSGPDTQTSHRLNDIQPASTTGAAGPPEPTGTRRSHSEQPTPRRRHWYGGPRRLAALCVVLLLVAGGAGWMILRGPTPATSASSSSSMHGQTQPKASKLMHALTQAARATNGLLPMSKCDARSASMVMCMNPQFGVTSVSFQTYPSQDALYDAYITAVRSLGNKLGTNSIKTNFGDCSRRDSFGEVSWNHDTMHPKTFNLAQARSGMLNAGSQAAGRLFCTFNGSEFDVIWTQDSGHLLGQLSGEPHKDTLDWWREFHHAIAFSGPPMKM